MKQIKYEKVFAESKFFVPHFQLLNQLDHFQKHLNT
jgi:hypothetical protein